MWRLFVVVALAGCGRFGFDDRTTDGGGSGSDALNVDDAGQSVYRTTIKDDMPLSYWRLGETGARDEVANNHGTIIGGVTTVLGATNDGDMAQKFDGSTGRIEFGDVFGFDGATPYTIELWARRDVPDDRVRWLIERSGTDAGTDYGWQIYCGETFLLHSRFSPEQGYAGTSQFEVGVWRYIVATFDGDEVAMYVDGEYTGGMLANPVGTRAGQLVFGDLVEGQFFKYDGILDEVAIYDRALSPSTIRAHYTASGR